MTQETRRRALLSTAKVACAVSLFTGCQSGTIEIADTGDDPGATALVRGEALVDTGGLEVSDSNPRQEKRECREYLENEASESLDWDRVVECCDLLGNPWSIGYCSPWGPPTPCALPANMVA